MTASVWAASVWTVILGLAAATFALRLGGFYLGRSLPQDGAWAAGLRALPGCLIASLVTFLVLQGGLVEWIAAAIAAVVALATRSLPLTMLAGVAAVWAQRSVF